ncbi:MAG: glycosyltransferase family 4 protein [Bacillales bacterium]
MNKIKINMYSKAETVDGQGVSSAYKEQISIIRDIDEFKMDINNFNFNDCHIRHFHTINPRFYGKIKKNRVNVCYVHFIPEMNDGSLKLPKWLFKMYKKYTLKFYNKNDELVVVNPYFIKELEKNGINKEKVTYIPNYVSKDRFKPYNKIKINELKKKFDIPLDKFVVLGVGQTQLRKGVLDFYEVAKNNPDMLFLWAGGFSFGKITAGYKEIKEAIDNPLPNLKFLGIIDRSEMNDYYNVCDVMFLPSYQELFPMTILEAVNLNKPVLLRDLELYEEILLNKYIKGNNNKEFSDLLNRLKTDKEFYREGEIISHRISEFYSRENITKLWKNYYRELVEKYKDRLKNVNIK